MNQALADAYEALFDVAHRMEEMPPPWARPGPFAPAMHQWLADLDDAVIVVLKAKLAALEEAAE